MALSNKVTVRRLFVCLTLCIPCLSVHADDTKKEKQSTVKLFDDGNGDPILSSSALVKLLNEKLNGVYQDLELVFSVCYSGEFVTRIQGPKGLKGEWTVSTSCDTGNCSTVEDGAKKGYIIQYAKQLKTQTTDATNKSLHEAAKNANAFATQNPQYAFKSETANNMKIHGGASNHAVLFDVLDTPTYVLDLEKGLKAAGYKDSEVTTYRALGYVKKPDGSLEDHPDRAKYLPTLTNLKLALDNLRKQLDADKGREKAFIFIQGHGAIQDRTVVYETGALGQSGKGKRVGDSGGTLQIGIDDPVIVQTLQEDLPKAGGGVWADDPVVHASNTNFQFSTISESFAMPTQVEVSMNNHLIGSVLMGNAAGADYGLVVPDPVLDAVMPSLLSTGLLDIQFTIPDTESFFRLAVPEDETLPGQGPLAYGLSIGRSAFSLQVPEPGTASIALVAALMIAMGQYRRSV